MKNVLILSAHQFFEGISPGRLNKTMAGVIAEEMEGRGYEVRQTDIKRGYDINTEVQQHVFIANTANYKFCGARILPSFSSYDVLKGADIDNDIARPRAHLVSVLETVGGEQAFA